MRRLSRPCYDKPHRCPGWAGGGWMYAKKDLCPEDDGGYWDEYQQKPGYIKINYESIWWKWKFHTCRACNVLIFPYVVRWTSWRSWWYVVRYPNTPMWWYKARALMRKW